MRAGRAEEAGYNANQAREATETARDGFQTGIGQGNGTAVHYLGRAGTGSTDEHDAWDHSSIRCKSTVSSGQDPPDKPSSIGAVPIATDRGNQTLFAKYSDLKTLVRRRDASDVKGSRSVYT